MGSPTISLRRVGPAQLGWGTAGTVLKEPKAPGLGPCLTLPGGLVPQCVQLCIWAGERWSWASQPPSGSLESSAHQAYRP